MNIGTRHLLALIALQEQETFTDAAIALGISQATVSRTIAQLESSVGVTLVARTTRSVELTEAGQVFLDHARRAIVEIDAAVAAASGHHGVLRLGYAWSALGRHTTEVVRGWGKDHPETALRLVRINSRHSGLSDGSVDFGIIRTAITNRSIESVVVGLEDRMCAVADDDPLAGEEFVGLAQLSNRTLAIDGRTGTTSVALWSTSGGVPETVSTTGLDDWMDLIATGEAIGMSAASTAYQHPRRGITFIPVRDVPAIEVRLAWHRDRPHPFSAELAARIRAAYSGR